MIQQPLNAGTSGQLDPKLNIVKASGKEGDMSATTVKEINGTTYKVTAKYTGQYNLAHLLRCIIKKEIQKA